MLLLIIETEEITSGMWKQVLLPIALLSLVSCQNRDTYDMPGNYTGASSYQTIQQRTARNSRLSQEEIDTYDMPGNYAGPAPRSGSASPRKDYNRGFRDGKVDARSGYQYRIRGGNQGNRSYADGYADGYESARG